MKILHFSRNLDDMILKEKFDALARYMWLWYILISEGAKYWTKPLPRRMYNPRKPWSYVLFVIARSGDCRSTTLSHSTHDFPCIKNIRWINRDRFAPWLPVLVIIAWYLRMVAGWSIYNFLEVDTLAMCFESRKITRSTSCFQLTSNWGLVCFFNLFSTLPLFKHLRCFLLAMPVHCCMSCYTWLAMDSVVPTTLGLSMAEILQVMGPW